MEIKDKKIIVIGLVVGVVVLIIFAISGYFSNKNEDDITLASSSTEDTYLSSSDTQSTEESTRDSLIDEILNEEETKASSSDDLEVINDSDQDNAFIEWQQTSRYEREMKRLNDLFIAAYYGNLESNERNAQLKDIVTGALYLEEELPESGQVYKPFIEELEVDSFVQNIDQFRGRVVNILSMNVDNVPQKMLLTVSMVQSDEWLIDQLTFEIIHLNEQQID